MGESKPSWPGPLTLAARAWLARADVVADPHQHGEHGIWTLASDILPHARIIPGEPLVAVWGDLTWRGRPQWDATRLDLLWIVPEGPVLGPPDPRGTHQHLVAGADRSPRATSSVHDADTERTADAPESLVGDLIDTIDVLLAALRRDRAAARAIRTEVLTRPDATLGSLLRTDAGAELCQIARLAAPAQTGLDDPQGEDD